MAMNPRDVPITREEVSGWLNIHSSLPKGKQIALRDFLLARIAAKNLLTDEVLTVGHDNLGETTPVVDMILDDLESYGYEAS